MAELKSTWPFFLANEAMTPNQDLAITDKYSGDTAATAALAGPDDIETAIAAASRAERAMADLHPFQRRRVLEHCVVRFRERFEELAYALCVEAGKPIKDSRGEVTRLIETFRVAALEAERIEGEVMDLADHERAAGYRGFTQRVPVGACSFISPFNFPLNLAAHKVAPAIAAGCPFVLKPASRTPLGALIIGEVLAECDLPKGAFSILPLSRTASDQLVEDDRLKLLSFTGSDAVGWDLKRRAGKKRVVMELGGNAACIVEPDWPMDDALDRMIFGAFYQSGQSCISVQRILVHRSIYEDFKTAFVARVNALKAGDPKEEDTFIGPMISDGEAERLFGWIEEASAGGADVLTGGGKQGRLLAPTVLENVPRGAEIERGEAFGPVCLLEPYDDYDAAIARVNDARYGLQAGVFTRDWIKAQRAWDLLDVGGVIIGDVPSWRVDRMPYGGVKDSGLGREGPRYAIEDFTDIRLMVTRQPPT